MLPAEVGFAGLQAAHKGGQQHGAETRQKLEQCIFDILTPTRSEIIYLRSKSCQVLAQRPDCARL